MVLKSRIFIHTETFLHLEDLILSDILRNAVSLFCENYEEIYTENLTVKLNVHTFNKYLLQFYSVLGTVLKARYSVYNEQDTLPLSEIVFQGTRPIACLSNE